MARGWKEFEHYERKARERPFIRTPREQRLLRKELLTRERRPNNLRAQLLTELEDQP